MTVETLMFDVEYFKDLLNETTTLIFNGTEDCSKKEETDARIESNIATLKYLTREIDDEEIRKKMMERIETLRLGSRDVDVGIPQSKTKRTSIGNDEHVDRIEKDVLKYSMTLHEKAKKLLESLQFDGKMIGDVTRKMSKNLFETSTTLKSVRNIDRSVSMSKIFTSTIIIFIIMYFIIRSM